MSVKEIFSFLLVFLTLACNASGQGFNISVSIDGCQRGNMELLIFDQGNEPRKLTTRIDNGTATFSGKVKQPVFAELRYRHGGTPLPFFIENSIISISFDTSIPVISRVVGSRSNSQMRYLTEICKENDNYDNLKKYISENPSEPFNTYLLYNYATKFTGEEMDSLMAKLDDNSKKTYHYNQLQTKIYTLARLQKGELLPSFTFIDDTGTKMIIDSLFVRMPDADSCNGDSIPTVIMVGATWCKQCAEARETLKQEEPLLRILNINLDQQKKGWDSPIAVALAIDHIPFITIVDSHGRIIACDIRFWEVTKLLN